MMQLHRRLAALAPLILRRIVNIHRLHPPSTQHIELVRHLHKSMLVTFRRLPLGLHNLPMTGSFAGHPRNRHTHKGKKKTAQTFHTPHFM